MVCSTTKSISSMEYISRSVYGLMGCEGQLSQFHK